ncbi:MAG TPA: DUF2203 domain-containing protein [Chloroflexota bacterium]|jgi:hypothetical protein|nr:DUF2203 domain-containing protein [Chloroflexota bacterium]
MEIGGASGAPGAPDEGRLFTLEEANALVPRVRELFESIHERMERLGELQQQLEEFRTRKRQGEHAGGEAKLVTGAMGTASRLSDEIRDLVVEIQATGCEVKDLGQGLIDFRTHREDRVVYLCWKLGEDEIRYWHELHTGFAGRQPL